MKAEVIDEELEKVIAKSIEDIDRGLGIPAEEVLGIELWPARKRQRRPAPAAKKKSPRGSRRRR